jgi:hypothetical protein
MNQLPAPRKDIVQSNNTAGGHIAGGHITTTEVAGDYVVNAAQPPVESALSRLYRKLTEEAAGDGELTEYIDQLSIFTRTVADEAVMGLDGKFAAAHREDDLDMAKAMKEAVYSQLRKNMFSQTFQVIYATLMAKIHEEFQTFVRPAIVKGADRAEIDRLVNLHVIKPIVAELETCATYDGAAIPTVRGMLYFLTGNCHLVWH